MNKKIIATAVTAALVLPMAVSNAADSETETVKVYGKLHMNLGKYDAVGTVNDNWRLNSFASRLGFKGQQKLDAGLSGTYQFETEVGMDSGVTSFATRNTYLGLKGRFGEVRLGQHDSPLKMAQGKFDQFGDTDGDLKNAGDQDGENRNINSITYLGEFGDIGVNVQLSPAEGNGTTSGQGFSDDSSIAVNYKSGPLYVALAMDSHDKKAGAENAMTRLIATYKVNAMQFGLLSQSGVETATTSANKENWLGLSFNMKLGKTNKIKAQYITVKDNAVTKTEGTQTTIGFDHKIGKKGTVYVMYNALKETGGTTTDTKSVSAGYVLKF